MKRFIILLIVSFFQYSCTSTDEHVQELFINEKERFYEFVEAACQDQILIANQGKFISFENLSASTREKIKNLEIGNVHYVVMERQDCPTGTKYSLEIIYSGDWHLEFKPCGFDYTLPRGHNENGLIERWGLDNNWILWVNNDFIG